MRDLLIKYLYLSYTVKLFGKIGRLPRAATVIMPVFCFAILINEVAVISQLTWIVFAGLIVLGFPILKHKLINALSLAIAILLSLLSIWSDYAWWEPLPFLYFSLGFFVKKTRFLWSVKYADLIGWEQKYQYLSLPYTAIAKDETVPTGKDLVNTYKELDEYYEDKYKGDEKFVSVKYFAIPLTAMLLLGVLYFVVGGNF
jgi:hypothetical protein